MNGFGCRVSQGGSRSFVLQFGADRQLLTLGRYHPDILPLAKARTEAKKILAEQVLGKHRAKSVRFETAKEAFLNACQRKNKPRTVYNYTHLLDRHFAFGRKQLSDISPTDITRKLDPINGDSQRAHATVLIKIFFRWAYRQGYVDASPADRLQAQKSTPRARVLSDAELRSIWRACEQRTSAKCGAGDTIVSTCTTVPPSPLPAPYGKIVRLLMLSGQRRGEIASLRTSWIEDSHVTLPAEATKNGRRHTFYLSPTAHALCASARQGDTSEIVETEPETRTNDTLLFPGTRKGGPFSTWSKTKVALDEECGVTDWTLHDLRRTFATRLAAFTPPHVVEKILNHASGTVSGVAAIYNRFEYAEECRAAVNKWERRLLAIVTAMA